MSEFAKMEFYVQCELKKQVENGFVYDIAWIPEKFATIGKQIKIKQEDDTWDCGWAVVKTYSRIEADKIEGCERDYLKQRKVSDV